MEFTVKLLGVRGSIPVSGSEFIKYGGNTTCVLIQIGEQNIVVDGGTGIMRLRQYLPAPCDFHLLLTHMHYDHVYGTTLCQHLFNPSVTATIYGESRGGLSIREQLSRLMSAPYFPIGIEHFGAKIAYRDIVVGESFCIGDVIVSTMRSIHPNECTLYKLSCFGKSVVCCFDYEAELVPDSALVEFARGSDLMLFDATYDEASFNRGGKFSKQGWGHSTWECGVSIVKAASVKQMLFIHHDPNADDNALDNRQHDIDKATSNLPIKFALGREGEEFTL